MSYWQLFQSFSRRQKSIFFVTLLLGGFFLFSQHSHGSGLNVVADPQPCERIGKVINLSITDQAIEPDFINAQLCDRLVFHNRGRKVHQPAFGPHPAHLDIPEFEAPTPIQPNEIFTVTLNRPGEYSYHDHLQPRIEGCLKVVETNR